VENTYYASLVFQRDGEFISIDSRPSDSIAIALRADAPIYADESLLELSSLDVEDATFDADEAPEGFGGPAAEEPDLSELDHLAEPLRDYLKRLDPEDFGRFEPP